MLMLYSEVFTVRAQFLEQPVLQALQHPFGDMMHAQWQSVHGDDSSNVVQSMLGMCQVTLR